MATLNIGGKRVRVDDSFLKLPPDQQQTTVDEIAAQIGVQPMPQSAHPFKSATVAQQTARPTEGSQNVVMAPKPNPQASTLPGILGQFQNTTAAASSGMAQGLTLGFGDEIAAGMMTPIEMGIDLFQGKGVDVGRAYQRALEGNQNTDDQMQALNPVAGGAAEISGAVMNPLGRLTLGARLPGMVAGGAAMGSAYGFGKGKTMDERLAGAKWGALTGAGAGAVAPLIAKGAGKTVERFLQKRATSGAIKGAPDASDLKAAASQLFQKVDQSGVTVDTTKFGYFVANLAQKARKDRINLNLDPKAFAAFQELIGAWDDIVKNGGKLTVSDIHTLRQIAQKAAMSTDGRDAMFAKRIIDGLDDFIVQPGATVLPKNRIGQGGNTAANDLLDAISTWGRARRVGLIEEAIYKAGNQASGLENGLRTQFRALLQNKKTRSLFTAAEIQAIEAVANGTMTSNIARLMGKFGFGGGSASNMLGGTIGFGAGMGVGGPLGGIITAILGTGARKLSGKLAENAASRAAKVVATPNIPNISLPALRPPLAPVAIGLDMGRRQLMPSQ